MQLQQPKVVVKSLCPIDTTKQAIRKQENGFANFVTDAIRDFFGADIVLVNARNIGAKVYQSLLQQIRSAAT